MRAPREFMRDIGRCTYLLIVLLDSNVHESLSRICHGSDVGHGRRKSSQDPLAVARGSGTKDEARQSGARQIRCSAGKSAMNVLSCPMKGFPYHPCSSIAHLSRHRRRSVMHVATRRVKKQSCDQPRVDRIKEQWASETLCFGAPFT